MTDLFENENYQELLDLLELRDIVNSKCLWENFVDVRELLRITSFELNIERGQIDSRFDSDTLIVPVAYRIEVSLKGDKEKTIFQFESIFEVYFTSSDMERVQQILENDTLAEFFYGYQMDKFAWSYLRSAFSHACASMGKKSFILPMLR